MGGNTDQSGYVSKAKLIEANNKAAELRNLLLRKKTQDGAPGAPDRGKKNAKKASTPSGSDVGSQASSSSGSRSGRKFALSAHSSK